MKFLCLLLLLSAFHANAATIADSEGTITKFRTSSSYDGSYIAAGLEPETLFTLSSEHVGCSWLGIKSTDKSFLSTLLSAQAQKKSVKVWYYSDKKSPLWASVCQAITIELK